MNASPLHLVRLPAAILWLAIGTSALLADDEQPIAIAAVRHEGPVDFEKEVLPIFTKNCTACHNASAAEGDLVLETPRTILKGGFSGPAVVPGNSGESLLMKAAAHLEEPYMPPADNSVEAVNLTGDQLGLIKLWIDQGATGEVSGAASIAWQSLPHGMNPIYAVAMSPDGQIAACSRANQIFIYNLASGALLARLTDPALVESGLYKQQGVAHLDLVQALAFSPDGDLLASGGYREVKLWRRPHGVRRADLPATASAVQAISVSPDGKWAAVGEASGEIKLWDLATLKDPKALAGHTAAVSDLEFLPDGLKLVSASQDKTVRLWNVADGAAVTQLETPAAVNALAVIADGTQVATGGADNIIRLWSLPAEAGAAIAAVKDILGHVGPVTALTASASDKGQLISGSGDGTIRIWNLADGKELRQSNHGAAVTALAVRPDGKQLASAGADNLIKLWNAADGQPWAASDKQPIAPMKGDAQAQFQVARLTQSQALATAKLADDKKALADAEAAIISASQKVTATQSAQAEAAKALNEKREAAKAPTAAKEAADKELAAIKEALTAANDAAAKAKAAAEKDTANAELAKANEEAAKAAQAADAKVKEIEKKVADAAAALAKASQEVTTAESGNTAAEQAAQAAVASVKGAVNAVPGAEQSVKNAEAALAQANTNLETAKQTDAAADKPVRALAYSADGTQLASASDNGLVRVWAGDNGLPADTFAGHQSPALAVAFLPDGAVLSGGADNAVFVWNAGPQWTLQRTIGSAGDASTFVDRVTALAFSHDGTRLAAGGGEPSRSGQLKIFNVADGALALEVPDAHSDTIFSLAFSPDDQHLASSAADRFVKVFNATRGAHEKSFEGHTHHVLGVAWQWDGKVLASCGADNVIKVWDFITGDQRRTVPGFGKEITSIAFVGMTPRVLASSGDNTVRLVNVDNGKIERNYAGPTDFMYATGVSADGKRLISGGQASSLFEWLVDDGQLLRTLAAPKPEENQPQTAQASGG